MYYLLEKIYQTNIRRNILAPGLVFFLLKGATTSLLNSISQKYHINVAWLYVSTIAVAFLLSFLPYIFLKLFFKVKKVFRGDERNSIQLRHSIIDAMGKSNTMRLLLLSGYTMFFDSKERYIYDTLKRLRENDHDKKVMALILNPESKAWEHRAKWFIKEMNKTSEPAMVIDVKEYKERCYKIITELKKIGAKVRLYNNIPIWRMHILDQYVFLSAYTSKNSGHLTSMYRFAKLDVDSMHHSLTKYFDDLWFQCKKLDINKNM